MVVFPIQIISDPEDLSVILVYLKRDILFHDSSFSFSESTITSRFGGNVSASGLSSIYGPVIVFLRYVISVLIHSTGPVVSVHYRKISEYL